MCPNECKGLSDVYGKEFEELYVSYENKKMYRKQIKARKLWEKIKISLIETGSPYIHFKDNINKKNNQKNIGLIRLSNLCVAPESLILTDKGYKQISLLEDKTVSVWNGKEFSKVKIVKTSDKSELITIYFNNFRTITCTKYHKFYIKNSIVPISAENLKINTELVNFLLPNIDNKLTYCENIKVIDIKHEKRFDKTYCCNEPNEHKIVINGILTGNCSEIMEVTNENESAVCNLASISLSSFVKTPNVFENKNIKIFTMDNCKPCF